MIRMVAPAPFFVTVALLQRHAPAKPLALRAATLQACNGDTVAWLDDEGQLLAVMGLYPLPEAGWAELFTVGLPAEELAPYIGKILRMARLMLRARLHSGLVGIRALTLEKVDAPGARMARMMGFVPVPSSAPRFSAWELR